MLKKTDKVKVLYKNKILLVSASLLVIISALISISIAFLMEEMINAGINKDSNLMKKMIILSVIVMVIFIVCGIVEYILKNIYIKKTMLSYKNTIINKLLKKDLKEFKLSNTGSYISIITNDMKIIEVDYIESIFKLIKQISLFIAGVISMIYISWKIFIVALIASIIPVIVSATCNNKTVKLQNSVSENNSNFTTIVKDLFSGFTVIKSYNIEEEIYSNIYENNDKLEETKRKYNNIIGLVEILTGTAGFIVVIATFTFGTYLCIKGEVQIGSIVAIIQLLNYLLTPISEISIITNKRSAAKTLINNINNILYVENEYSKGYVQKDNLDKYIEFDNVSFAYNDKGNALSNINLKLEKGKKYALVGLSGSGKSTLINLLMGYYNNYEGKIKFDDVNLKDIDSNYLYKMLSIIQQDVFIFDETLENNITLFKEYSKDKIKEAIKRCELTSYVEKNGIDFKCGENGNKLSGGERQRISIGRALIKNTPIILLDEATSSLDNATSLAIEQTVLNLKDITSIVVTHKLNENLLKQYDEILVMKSGQIVEKGTFSELMEKKNNLYSIYNVSNYI